MDGTFFICNKKDTSSIWAEFERCTRIDSMYINVSSLSLSLSLCILLVPSIFSRYYSSYVDCGEFDIHRKHLFDFGYVFCPPSLVLLIPNFVLQKCFSPPLPALLPRIFQFFLLSCTTYLFVCVSVSCCFCRVQTIVISMKPT